MPATGRRPKPLYVEITIDADRDLIWTLTQQPRHHERWDARFTRITYASDASAAEPVRFRYSLGFRPGPLLTGVGITTAQRDRPDGTRVSALRFRADGRLSPLQSGAGYWRYTPALTGVRFVTGYDYSGWPGTTGARVDRWLVRPFVGWLTAWSFDRLRLWAELGITPERSRRQALAEVAVRTAAVAATVCLSGSHAPWAALAAALIAGLLPPLPTTPAARRCLRRPPDRAAAHAATRVPTALTALETP